MQVAPTTDNPSIRFGGGLSQTSGQLYPSSPALDLPVPEPLYLGMRLPTLLKTLIISVLFIATFRFDLHRLWDKTNPFYGDANWGHAICVPLIGLYYLYLNREALKAAPVEPLLAGNFTRRRFVSAAICVAVGLAVYFVTPLIFHFSDLLMAPIRGMGMGLAVLGLLVGALDWGIGLLLFGLLV